MSVERIVLRAPAKINWTLEVLGKRPDGYHEVSTTLQTIDVCDTITLRHADAIELEIMGDCSALADEPVEDNLAYRAAALLKKRCGYAGGAHIDLEKRIPVGAGLGGGSSDAAAVLRGLRALWQLDLSDDDLMRMAADLGSDVPFFVVGGRALATGRGEKIEPLPKTADQTLVIAWPERRLDNKTARMYAALKEEHFREPGMAPNDGTFNTFELVLDEVDREAADLFVRAAKAVHLTPRLCGSGPAFFLIVPAGQAAPTIAALEGLGLHAIASRPITAAEATAMSVDA
ncbi:MAG: 4-(cytidine 5'-diphospho)-2-C-methyl-D-erythritol kinase [Dehalococcoidia bacterium]